MVRTSVPTLAGLMRMNDTFIFDCDGVIWGMASEDTTTAVTVINTLLRAGKRTMFITNNSNKTRAAFVEQLEKLHVDFSGVDVEDKLGMMVSAAYTTAEYLRSRGLRRPYVITSDVGLLQELASVGITDVVATITADGKPDPDFESPKMIGGGGAEDLPTLIGRRGPVDCVVVGWDMGLTARKVAVAINYLKWHEERCSGEPGYEPMPLIACSSDAGGVLGKGENDGVTRKVRAIGNGAMADIIARSFDPPLRWIDMGKPSDALLNLLSTAYRIDPVRCCAALLRRAAVPRCCATLLCRAADRRRRWRELAACSRVCERDGEGRA